MMKFHQNVRDKIEKKNWDKIEILLKDEREK